MCYTVKGNGLTKLINKITNETSGVLGSIGTKGLHRSKRNVKRATNATEVSIQSEGAARGWSTVVKISIPPPSFKPDLLSLSRSPLL